MINKKKLILNNTTSIDMKSNQPAKQKSLLMSCTEKKKVDSYLKFDFNFLVK